MVNSESTYSNVLSKEIYNFLIEVNELINDERIKEIISTFEKIKNQHILIEKNLLEQKEKNNDWNKISFVHSFVDLYPQIKSNYVHFCNEWEYFCKKNFFLPFFFFSYFFF